ncbi:FhaA domain-containing protein [Streptomyces vinaceus]|uniref:FhaA domain-containing protein n=1 Tax=Streptomyces vinaceus TaxID=1960 RepID=UPI0035D8F9AA
MHGHAERLGTCDEQAVVCSFRRTGVPNLYTVELTPPVFNEIGPRLTVVGQELTDRLERHLACAGAVNGPGRSPCGSTRPNGSPTAASEFGARPWNTSRPRR